MRLIDADALREAMYHDAFETDSDMQKWDSGCWIRYKMFEKHIEAAPTIDPVKHGRWIAEKSYSPRSETGILYECSECGARYDYETNFCPRCGAKMERSEDEGD